MNRIRLGVEIERRRRRLGWTQVELAERVGTTQPVISRLECGAVEPTIGLLERVARATGEPLALTLGEDPRETSPEERRRLIEAELGTPPFDPWERDPTEAEARTLLADGLTRARDER
jgi:transcriptional regulator with XRE-family HTH domain